MADVEAEQNAALPANMLPSEAHGGRDEVPVGISSSDSSHKDQSPLERG